MVDPFELGVPFFSRVKVGQDQKQDIHKQSQGREKESGKSPRAIVIHLAGHIPVRWHLLREAGVKIKR